MNFCDISTDQYPAHVRSPTLERLGTGIVNDGSNTLFQITVNRNGTNGDLQVSSRADGNSIIALTSDLTHPVDQNFVFAMVKVGDGTVRFFMDSSLQRSASYTSTSPTSDPEYDIPLLARANRETVDSKTTGSMSGLFFVDEALSDAKVAAISEALL